MRTVGETDTSCSVIDDAGLAALLGALADAGYRVLGPQVRDGAVVLGPIDSPDDLPAGWSDAQEPGRYRLLPASEAGPFDHAAPAQGWKRFLYPPEERIWAGSMAGSGFVSDGGPVEIRPEAFFAVRPCDLAAMHRLDTVFAKGGDPDTSYAARRQSAFIVAVNCTHPGGTCFCDSMATGPAAGEGYDLGLTDISEHGAARYLVRSGSAEGRDVLEQITHRPADAAALAEAERRIAAARAAMGRTMIADVPEVLRRTLESPLWSEIAERCLACANCTMVCPTCFCATIEDSTDLTGAHAERWRKWDSCFTIDFSYIHGGSIRRDRGARYRQWMTHKLSNWWDQFGTSGCVGCGRCITWCPVGIDITEEARRLRDDQERHA